MLQLVSKSFGESGPGSDQVLGGITLTSSYSTTPPILTHTTRTRAEPSRFQVPVPGMFLAFPSPLLHRPHHRTWRRPAASKHDPRRSRLTGTPAFMSGRDPFQSSCLCCCILHPASCCRSAAISDAFSAAFSAAPPPHCARPTGRRSCP